MLNYESEATVMRDCHESVQSGPPAESSCPSKRHERVRSNFELRGQHARRQVSGQRENALQEACFARQ